MCDLSRKSAMEGISHVRFNQVKLTEQTLHQSLAEKGKSFDANEEDKSGFRVEYADGHVSWCPTQASENASYPIEALPFGFALELCRQFDVKVARCDWPEGTYLHFMDVSTEVTKEGTVFKPMFCKHSVDNPFKDHEENVLWTPTQDDMTHVWHLLKD